MPLLTPVVRSRSGCWMATLDPHLLVLAWIHPSVRPVLAAVYRWRRRSHGSVGLGILLAVPLVLANLVHPSLVGLVVDGRNSWGWPHRTVHQYRGKRVAPLLSASRSFYDYVPFGANPRLMGGIRRPHQKEGENIATDESRRQPSFQLGSGFTSDWRAHHREGLRPAAE